MDFLEIEDYGQFVDLTTSRLISDKTSMNKKQHQSRFEYIYNPLLYNNYSGDSVDGPFLDDYSNPTLTNIEDENTQSHNGKNKFTSLWLCCKLLTRPEFIENCIIPTCIICGTVYIVCYLFG